MKFGFLGIGFLLLSACNFNQNPAVRGVDLRTHTQDQETILDLETIVSLGNLKLPNAIHPVKSGDREIGEVSIQQLDDGTNRLALSMNCDDLEKTDGTIGKTLPNGREIPSQVKSEGTLTGIPFLENSRIYYGSHKGDLYAGIALNLPALDHILSRGKSPLNLFLDFPFSDEISAVAGVYSSPQPAQNGIAIFAKKSQHLDRAIASIQSSPSELKSLDRLSRFRLNYLFSKNATVRIK